MNYNQIAEKIEEIACERLEHFKDVPAALLLGPDDYNTLKQRMMEFSNGPSMGFTTIAFNTSGGRVDLLCKKEIPAGVFVPVEPGESPEEAYKNFYVSKIDRELNDIVYRIVEDLE